ncbi:hypothetical protein C8J57DRAFT_1614185 [Mycena rebaudengoi]|nr:hypothetical protein C8J57DRAFT_1614185 [Mycena rebaudengoi]
MRGEQPSEDIKKPELHMAGPRVERGPSGCLFHLPATEAQSAPIQFLDRCRKTQARPRSDLPGENIMSPDRSLSWKHEVKKNGATQEEQKLVPTQDPESNGDLRYSVPGYMHEENEESYRPSAYKYGKQLSAKLTRCVGQISASSEKNCQQEKENIIYIYKCQPKHTVWQDPESNGDLRVADRTKQRQQNPTRTVLDKRKKNHADLRSDLPGENITSSAGDSK